MQMKFPLLVAASALALSFAACSPENPASEASNATEVALDENTTVVTEEVDSGVINFVEKATLSNMYEIEAAKIALERSKVQSVKDFAQAVPGRPHDGFDRIATAGIGRARHAADATRQRLHQPA